jgi:phage terminase small subunit
VLRNPRIWIYLVVGLVAAGLIAYSQWRDSDEQRLKRCIDASISQMKQDTPALEKFDNAQPVLVSMARASCAKQLGINPQTP